MTIADACCDKAHELIRDFVYYQKNDMLCREK